MSRRILVVTTAPVEGGALRDRVLEHAGNGQTELKVVATASDLSPLDWLASDEDEARKEAAERATEVGEAVAPEAERVEAEVGDTDPVLAIEDAPAHVRTPTRLRAEGKHRCAGDAELGVVG